MECEPKKPAWITCEGMMRLFALPCTIVQSRAMPTGPPEVCVEYRKAMARANDYAEKVVGKNPDKSLRYYQLKVYAVFKWTTKAQYHFAEYMFWPVMPGDAKHVCIYFGKAPLQWGTWWETLWCIDPIRTWPSFRDVPLTADGSPVIGFALPPGKDRPDAGLFSNTELRAISAWEEATFMASHRRRVCVARYEHLGMDVRIKATGQVGTIIDILPPERKYELWDPERPDAWRVAVAGHYLKHPALRYLVETVDKKKHWTTIRALEETA